MASLPQGSSPNTGSHIGDIDDPGFEKLAAKWVGAAFFGAFLGALAVIPLDSAVVGSGSVTVSGNRQAVQHKAGGIVTALHVREGQSVRKGDVLLALSSTDISAQERAATLETIALLAQRERLIAERDDLASVAEPAEFRVITGSDRRLADAALVSQRRVFAARRNATDAQIGILSQRTRQTQEQAVGFRRQIEANREQRRLIGAELDGMRKLAANGFASINRIRALERAAAQLDGEYGSLNAQVARVGEAGGEISMQAVGVRRDVIKEVSQDLRDVTLRIDENQGRIRSLREQLAQAQVRAPASGRVVNLKQFTIGGVVAPGEVIMEIVPQDREMIVTAHIAPSDADDVRIGQEAQARFPGWHDRRAPVLDGRVSGVSADNLTDPRTGTSFFNVEVSISKASLAGAASSAIRHRIVAGMPAEVLIARRKRTALQYLLDPILRGFWHTGREE